MAPSALLESAVVESPVVESPVVESTVPEPGLFGPAAVVAPADSPVQATPVQVAAPSRARQASSTPLRLTRRGRLVLAMGTAVVAGVLCFLAVNSAQAADQGAGSSAAAGHAMAQIIVQPGQTLWSIAQQADPTADTRLVVQRIVTINSLSSQNLTAGQHLSIPQG